MKDKIKLEVKGYCIKIYMFGLLHLQLKKDDWYGLQSYKHSTGDYRIQYYLKSGMIETQYDDKAKWETILKLLDKAEL
jgi:hypothetical protein